MKILGLLNSNVRGGDASIPREDLFPGRLAGPLSKALGEPVEITARALWPTPRLPGLVERWTRELRPELVVFSVPSFWFLYESAPVRLERRLGAPGRAISSAALRAAATPWLAHNAPFRWGRERARQVIGGDSWFEPAEVVDAARGVIQAALRAEGTYVIVFGPSGGDQWARDDAGRERLARRRDEVDRALAEFCRQRHVEYWDQKKKAAIRDPRPQSLQGDGLHLDREGHRRTAEHQFGLALGMVNRALAHARAGAAGNPST